MLQLLISVIQGAPAPDFRNTNQLRQVAQQMSKVLISNYVPGKTASQGAMFDRSNDPSINGFQWWENGVMWSALMDYSALTGDSQHLNTIVPALTLASFKTVGSFLGPNKGTAASLGKWNDDILWWALGPMTGAELFPGQIMNEGVSYLDLAKNTYDEVWEQWDTTSCGGGIFWSRDRLTNDPKTKNFKSTITHAQQMLLGARLYGVTKDPIYLQHANAMYSWMKSAIINKDYDVYDGMNAGPSNTCALFIDEHSYNSGILSGALATWFSVTGDQNFLQEAERMAARGLTRYTVNNGVVTDLCEGIRNPSKKCPVNQVYLKGTFIRGISYVYKYSKNDQLKQQIQQVFETTGRAMFPLCDTNLVCNSQDWAAGTPATQPNIHSQINALELMNGLLTINSAGSTQRLTAPTAKPPSDIQDTFGSASTPSFILAGLSLLWLLL